ncbi:MAG TPA: hypothetical protein VFH03_02355 [Actinoplanes sp.]|nr:hypothetical protein [Actinoplanes sp.]
MLPLVITVILLLLAVLILAGPPLEGLIDRMWPSGRQRPSAGSRSGVVH